MSTRRRFRIVVDNVGNYQVPIRVVGAPLRGLVHYVRATADVLQDTEATIGTTGATDLELEVREAIVAVGLGGPDEEALVLDYALTPATPSLTIDSQENPPRYYQLRSDGQLYVAPGLDLPVAGGDATAAY